MSDLDSECLDMLSCKSYGYLKMFTSKVEVKVKNEVKIEVRCCYSMSIYTSTKNYLEK